jgi:hypothetical protein
MRLQRPLSALLTGCATLLAAAGIAVTGGGTAQAATPLPQHVFAPYFEAWTGESPATLAQQSGAKNLTLAFAQTATKGSCTPYWNGDTGMPIAASTFGSDIAAIRAAGGDVIPSLGGYTADTTGTELADSCTDVNQIAAALEKIITTYEVSRIDLDVEADSLDNTAGIDRRNKAIKLVDDWAAANGRSIQFSYTLPTTTSGLAANGLAVLSNAVQNNARIDVVNLMTFDYYDNAAHNMATDTQTAATGLYNQLAALYPAKTPAQLWASVGIIEMVGVDDFGAAETFTLANAATVYNWAVSKGVNTLSFWALQRDNGGCAAAGTAGADNCSGIAQNTWDFSHVFAPFTSGGGGPVTNDFSLGLSPAAGSVTAGAGTTSALSTAVTAGAAQTVNLSVSGAPAGVTASLSASSVTAGSGATLTVATTAAAAPGSYPLTVTGTAPSGSHTATYTLTVQGTGGGGSGSIVNGGLETGALAPWTCQSGGAVVAAPAHSGTHALQAAATSGQTGECTQSVTLAPNHAYTLTAWVQGGYAYVGVSGGATASTWASSTGWTKLTVPFTTGANGTVSVYLHGWYGQGNVYGDDFSVA